MVSPTGSPLPVPDSSQSSSDRDSVLIQGFQTFLFCPSETLDNWSPRSPPSLAKLLRISSEGSCLVGDHSPFVTIYWDIQSTSVRVSVRAGVATGYSPFRQGGWVLPQISRTVVREGLQHSDLAWSLFVAPLDYGVARCSQTHPLVLHPTSGSWFYRSAHARTAPKSLRRQLCRRNDPPHSLNRSSCCPTDGPSSHRS